MDNNNIAKIFKALCDENRVEIIRLLKSGSQCACNIAETLGLGQSKLSYHMKILCDSGLIESWPAGKWMYYKINPIGCEYALNLFQELTSISDDQPCSCNTAESESDIATNEQEQNMAIIEN